MTEETTQVHPTSQEAESTQPDVQLDQSTSENGEESQNEEGQGEQQEGKDPNAWALKRINSLTAQKHEAERLAQAKAGEAERYRMLVEQFQRGETPESLSAKPESEQNIDELVTKRAQEIAQQQEIAARGASVSKAGSEQFADFQSAVQTLDAIGITGEQVHALLGMDDAHKVIYILGKDPDEASRILSLPPLQQGRELERLASKPAPVAPPKAVSKAPAPVKPVDGGTTADVDTSKMSMEEWAKWRAKSTKNRF